MQETKNSDLFHKNCTQKNSKCHNSTWRKLTRINRNWAGKLLVTLLAAYIFWKKLCSQTFKDSSEEVFRENIGKMDERVFFVNLQVGISQLHYRLTSLHKQFSGKLSKWTHLNGYFSILCKMLEKHLWNSFLQYFVVEILQFLHKIAVSPRCSLKQVFWKTPQNSQINARSSHLEVFCLKERCF